MNGRVTARDGGARAVARAAVGGVALALAALVAGCGGGEGGADCPPSHVLVDGACQPLFPDVAGGTDDTGAPRDADGPADGGGATDADGGGATDTHGTDGGAPDSEPGDSEPGDGGTGGPDTADPTGAVGDPCSRDRDCQDGFVCLGWSGGYCTRLGCDEPGAECPDDAVCLRVEAGAAACFAGCEDAADCRAGGYACKALADGEGARAAVCHELRDDAGGLGAACAGHAECEGARACVRSLPGGACLSLFCLADGDCDADGFAQGGACVRLDGVQTCLARCTTDGDCAAFGDGTLSCETRRNTAGDSLPVCVSGAAGLPIGATCLADGECDSGVCETLGDGRCTVDDLPCFATAECPAASTCLPIDPPIRACSAPCGASQVCPAGACVLADDGDTACRPACRWDAGHQSHDCRADTGWTCLYGVPRADESRKGYYCAAAPTGAVGAPCREDDDCAGALASCLRPTDRPDATYGYCSRACSPQQPCPFGTWCLSHGAALRCQKVCFSPLDCAEGHTCRAGSPHDTCVPE